MRTINVQISDFEYNALGLSKNMFFFSEIVGLIEKQQARNKTTISKSMQKALDDEQNGRVTKLVNHSNAVAEILG